MLVIQKSEQFTVNSLQSTVYSQQSTVNSQQFTVNNQQHPIHRSKSQSEIVSPIHHRLKPMAETQNLLKQVEEASFNVFEHVSCNSLGIHSQEKPNS